MQTEGVAWRPVL